MTESDALAPGRAVSGLPRGAQDLLPDACASRRRLTERLLDRFAAWGYRAVATPALELYDVLARGLSEADRRRCVRFVDGTAGELLSLRADATPQIARMIGERRGGELAADAVHRLCYATEVVRRPASVREPAEVHQVGVELVGDGHAAADAEIVALSAVALADVGLTTLRLDVAHARLVTRALHDVGLSDAQQIDARARIAAKDRDGTAAVLHAAGLDATRCAAIASLCDLFGGVAVLDRASAELAGLGPRVRGCVAELFALVEQLVALDARLVDAITIDLGEVRGFDYYSGVRVRGWAVGVERAVVRGGRYDELMARYGADAPAIGFAIDLDALEAALAAAGKLPVPSPSVPAHVVALATDASSRLRARAAARAATLRAEGLRAWVEPAASRERAHELAAAAGAAEVSWLSENEDEPA